MSKQKNGSSPNDSERPTKDRRVSVNMRLPSKLLAELRNEAAETDRSVTSIVVEVLRDRYKPDDRQ